MKKLVLLLLLLHISAFCSPCNISKRMIRLNTSFDTQSFLLSKKCFLADTKIDGQLAYKIIDKWCLTFGINQKYILCRMQQEYNIFSGHVEGKYFIFPYKRQKRKVKYVLEEILGYGLTTKLYGRKFVGFENQVKNCSRQAKECLDKGQSVENIISIYDQTSNSVEKFCKTWRYLWPSDF